MEHGGGEQLKLNGRDYDRIRQWLEDGAPEPTAKDPHVTKLEVFPPARVMVPGEQQQLAVTAVWSDGRREDVTPTAQFDALNDSVAAVTPAGLVTAKTAGETHVMIRFGGQAVVAQVTLPFATIANYPKLPANNFIDEKLIAKWKDLGLTPSPLCAGRRVPAPAVPRRHRHAADAGGGPGRSSRTSRPTSGRRRSTRCWSGRSSSTGGRSKWGDLLRINRRRSKRRGCGASTTGCGRSSATTAGGRVRPRHRDRGGEHVHRRPGELLPDRPRRPTTGPRRPARCSSACGCSAPSATTTRSRSGARTTTTAWPRSSPGSARRTARSSASSAARRSSSCGRPARPATRARAASSSRTRSTAPDMDDEFDRRKKLADWLTAPDNPFFARNVVNRFWGYLMGRGLVEPLDDMRATNPASNPELLDALADDFVKRKFDLKHLLRTIFDSRAYQLSSQISQRQQGGRGEHALHPVHGEAADRRAARRRGGLRHRHAGEVHRRPARHAGDPAAGHEVPQLPDGHVRPAAAADHLRVRADDEAEHRPGDAPARTATS